MKRIIYLQLIWLSLAVSYNIVSLYLIANDQTPLQQGPTDVKLYSLSVFAMLICVGFAKKYRLYLLLGVPLTLILIVTGVGLHIHTAIFVGIQPRYSSAWAWGIAVFINVLGAIAFLRGLYIANNKLRRDS